MLKNSVLAVKTLLPVLAASFAFQAQAGTILVANFSSSNILSYNDVSGAFISTFVATGSGGLAAPGAMAYGPDGNLYVSSIDTNAVLEYNGATGAFMKTFESSSAGQQMAFGPDGNLYVADYNNNTGVLEYSGANGAFIRNFVPNVSVSDQGMAFGPDGSLYVAVWDGSNGSINRYNESTGAFESTYSTGFSTPPGDLIFGADGTLYADQFHNNVGVDAIAPGGGAPALIIPGGSGGLNWPAGLVLDNGELYVSSGHGTQIGVYNPTTGAFIDNLVTGGNGLTGTGTLLLQPSPEPGTIGLCLAAAGIAWAFRRRRNAPR